jgi:hypothetical protein
MGRENKRGGPFGLSRIIREGIMPVQWMCGFESGLDIQNYINSGWYANDTAGNMSTSTLDGNTHQPISGFGGGRYSLKGWWVYSRYLEVPSTALTNIGGPHDKFIWHFSLERNGKAGNWGGQCLFEGANGVTNLINLSWTSDDQNSSTLSLYINGGLEATSTTTWLSWSPAWKRFVIDADGVNGDYTVYVDGIPEISVVGGTAFSNVAGIDGIKFSPCGRSNNSNYSNAIDHLVLWDHTNHAADLQVAMGDIFIQGLLPNDDVDDGTAWVRSDTGNNTDLHQAIDDNSTADYIHTTQADEYRIAVENRADINAAWAPSEVHAVQALHLPRVSGTLTTGEVHLDFDVNGVPGTNNGPGETLSGTAEMVWHLEQWPPTANVTTDLDSIKTGLKVT